MRSSFSRLSIIVMLSGVAFVGYGVRHFDDPPLDVPYRSFHVPGKRQYTFIGVGATLIVMGFTLRKS
jgi:hypothetical protein